MPKTRAYGLTKEEREQQEREKYEAHIQEECRRISLAIHNYKGLTGAIDKQIAAQIGVTQHAVGRMIHANNARHPLAVYLKLFDLLGLELVEKRSRA